MALAASATEMKKNHNREVKENYHSRHGEYNKGKWEPGPTSQVWGERVITCRSPTHLFSTHPFPFWAFPRHLRHMGSVRHTPLLELCSISSDAALPSNDFPPCAAIILPSFFHFHGICGMGSALHQDCSRAFFECEKSTRFKFSAAKPSFSASRFGKDFETCFWVFGVYERFSRGRGHQNYARNLVQPCYDGGGKDEVLDWGDTQLFPFQIQPVQFEQRFLRISVATSNELILAVKRNQRRCRNLGDKLGPQSVYILHSR